MKFHDARLSNLSRREDSRHIFISSPRCGGGATRKRVSALRENERERGGGRGLTHGLIDDTRMTITVKTRGIR